MAADTPIIENPVADVDIPIEDTKKETKKTGNKSKTKTK